MDRRPARQRRANRPARVTSPEKDVDAASVATPAEQPTSLPDQLWHYTDAAGLLGILTNVEEKPDPNVVGSGSYKPVLWATAAQFLNDRRELTHGLDLMLDYLREWGGRGLFQSNPAAETFISKVCDAIQSIIDREYPDYLHCCTVSFSEDPDMLSQWRAYGQGTGGFAIGFDPAKFPRSDGSNVHRAGLGLHRVEYLSDALEQPLIDATYSFIAESMDPALTKEPTSGNVHGAVQALAFVAASVKHKGFREEREWRFVQPGFVAVPEFRAGATGLMPYRDVTELTKDAVIGLYVGPGPYQYENYLAAKSMLGRYGYDEAARNVHCSDTPFR